MRVLIAVEDETFGQAIVDFVSKHQWQPGTIFKVLNAAEPPYVGDTVTALYGNDLQNELLKERVQHGENLVGWLKARLIDKIGNDAPVECNVSIGRPHKVILETAKEWKADMTILGSHGRSGFDRFLMGSVSLAVLSHAPCSVVIVRLPENKDQEHQPQGAASKNLSPARSG